MSDVSGIGGWLDGWFERHSHKAIWATFCLVAVVFAKVVLGL
jgi:hypothetical protein